MSHLEKRILINLHLEILDLNWQGVNLLSSFPRFNAYTRRNLGHCQGNNILRVWFTQKMKLLTWHSQSWISLLRAYEAGLWPGVEELGFCLPQCAVSKADKPNCKQLELVLLLQGHMCLYKTLFFGEVLCTWNCNIISTISTEQFKPTQMRELESYRWETCNMIHQKW